MDIKQVKELQAKLATEIGALVNSFQDQTGAKVVDVRLVQFITDASNVPVHTEVEIKLEL